jgi:dipeptidyl aminopeptidase/acylaminoacyl peptidase
MSRRPVTIDDLFRFKHLSDPQISPDGATIAFVQAEPDLEKNTSHSHIWLAPSDIGSIFGTDWEIGGTPWDNRDGYIGHSPIAHVANCKTPALILHSENDYRCPVEQGEQFYVALRNLRVPVQFVRFPGESHDLSRSGQPKHRKERYERIVEWLGKYL